MIESPAESDAPVQEEGDKRCHRNGQSLWNQGTQFQKVNTEVQDQTVESQGEKLDQIECGETKDDPVFFLEIKTSVQQKTTDNAAMEADDIGPHVGNPLVKQGKNHKFHQRADDADDGIEIKMPVFSINLS